MLLLFVSTIPLIYFEFFFLLFDQKQSNKYYSICIAIEIIVVSWKKCHYIDRERRAICNVIEGDSIFRFFFMFVGLENRINVLSIFGKIYNSEYLEMTNKLYRQAFSVLQFDCDFGARISFVSCKMAFVSVRHPDLFSV